MKGRPLPLGIYEKAIPNRFTWEEKINIAKQAGFDYLEISIDESDERLARLDWSPAERAELRALLARENFSLGSMCLSGHRRFPFGSADPSKRAKAYEIMAKAIDLAEDLGIKNIQLAGYDVYYEPHTEDSEAYFIEGLRWSAARAAAAQIMLSIEIMDTEFIGTISRALKYIEGINSPWLKIYPDLGNLSRWAADPAAELEKGRAHMVAIHLKDTQPGVFKEVAFGAGTVDFQALSKTLKKIKYTGPFLIEMWADNQKESTQAEAIAFIREARLWIENEMKLGDFQC